MPEIKMAERRLWKVACFLNGYVGKEAEYEKIEKTEQLLEGLIRERWNRQVLWTPKRKRMKKGSTRGKRGRVSRLSVRMKTPRSAMPTPTSWERKRNVE